VSAGAQPRSAFASLGAAGLTLALALLGVGSIALADVGAWDGPLLALFLAWPVALALERSGPARPLAGLAAGGLVAGLVALLLLAERSVLSTAAPPLIRLAACAASERSVLVVLALGLLGLAGAAPLLVVRRGAASLGTQLLAGGAGGALLAAALLPGGARSGEPLFLFATALVAGSGIGLGTGLTSRRETDRRAPEHLAVGALAVVLLGLGARARGRAARGAGPLRAGRPGPHA
jgi:hypothetical protein